MTKGWLVSYSYTGGHGRFEVEAANQYAAAQKAAERLGWKGDGRIMRFDGAVVWWHERIYRQRRRDGWMVEYRVNPVHSPQIDTDDVLRIARVQVAKGWTRNAQARTKWSRRCEATFFNAVRWSVYGACVFAARDEPDREALDGALSILFDVARDIWGGNGWDKAWYYNDYRCRTQKEALAWIDEAINRRRSS